MTDSLLDQQLVSIGGYSYQRTFFGLHQINYVRKSPIIRSMSNTDLDAHLPCAAFATAFC